MEEGACRGIPLAGALFLSQVSRMDQRPPLTVSPTWIDRHKDEGGSQHYCGGRQGVAYRGFSEDPVEVMFQVSR